MSEKEIKTINKQPIADIAVRERVNKLEEDFSQHSKYYDKLLNTVSQQSKEKANRIVETASGETIVVTDSAEAKPLGLAIDGKSEQAQYSGKNLLNLKHLKQSTSYGITFTPVFDDNENLMYIEANGTNDGTRDSSYTILGVGNELYNQILGKEIIISGSVGGSRTTYKLQYWSQAAVIASLNGDSSVGTVLETTDWNISIVVRKGQTVSKLRFYPMVRLATVTDGTYEPFCDCQPSPSPSYPQEIRNIGVYDEASGKYAVEVKCTGKNLLDCSGLVEKTVNGITFTPVYDENGLLAYIEANGTASGGNSIYATNYSTTHPELYELISGKEVIVSGSVGGSASTYQYQFWFNTGAIVSYDGDRKGVIPEVVDTWNVAIIVYNGYTANKLRFYPMIRLAEITDDTYKPYKETTATVYLDEPLRGIDEYVDTICMKNGLWGIERNVINIKPTAINVTAITDTDGNSAYRVRCSLVNKSKNLKVLSNCFIKTTDWTDVNCLYLATSFDHVYFIISAEELVDVSAETAQNWIDTHEVEIEYVLATPTFTPFEDQAIFDGLSMFYPTTVISNDCNANMEVEYIADTKNYIDKLKAKHESDITALKTAIVALGGTV